MADWLDRFRPKYRQKRSFGKVSERELKNKTSLEFQRGPKVKKRTSQLSSPRAFFFRLFEKRFSWLILRRHKRMTQHTTTERGETEEKKNGNNNNNNNSSGSRSSSKKNERKQKEMKRNREEPNAKRQSVSTSTPFGPGPPAKNLGPFTFLDHKKEKRRETPRKQKRIDETLERGEKRQQSQSCHSLSFRMKTKL